MKHLIDQQELLYLLKEALFGPQFLLLFRSKFKKREEEFIQKQRKVHYRNSERYCDFSWTTMYKFPHFFCMDFLNGFQAIFDNFKSFFGYFYIFPHFLCMDFLKGFQAIFDHFKSFFGYFCIFSYFFCMAFLKGF